MRKSGTGSKRKRNSYRKPEKSLVFGLGAIPKEGIPEIKLRYQGKRFLGKLVSTMDAADFIRKLFPRGSIELQEQYIILYVNQRNKIIGYYKHTVGTARATLIDVRIIFSAAILSLSSGIIIAHNHPSRDPKPSEADVKLTKKIRDGARLLDITLMDHLILTKNNYYSFLESDLI